MAIKTVSQEAGKLKMINASKLSNLLAMSYDLFA
jgi:hypothetical protein